MKLSDFDFELPREQIAQVPLPERGSSRLMTLCRQTGAVGHRLFSELPELLRPGDVLVLNDARVIPARLLGRKVKTQGRVELLVIRPAAGEPTPSALEQTTDALEWICLGQASKGLKVGTALAFEGGLEAVVRDELGEGYYRIGFRSDAPGAFRAALGRAGKLPLPPYIRREPTPADAERYQTVYARSLGSVAAPTAGLHLTQGLLDRLERRGVVCVALTLDVGPGTFLPLREEALDGHRMHPERFRVSAQVAAAVNEARSRGNRVVAVGTTVVRALESATDPDIGRLAAGAGETSLFIRPGFAFRHVDALVTNFHLPRSTLLMLVCAFAGQERALAAYREAVARGYRFFSYGDAMWIGGVGAATA